MSDLEKKEEQSVKLYEALEGADPELLARSEKTKKVVPLWKYSGMMAACIAFLVVGGISLFAIQMSGGMLTKKEAMNSISAGGQAFRGDTAAAQEAPAEEREESFGEASSTADSVVNAVEEISGNDSGAGNGIQEGGNYLPQSSDGTVQKGEPEQGKDVSEGAVIIENNALPQNTAEPTDGNTGVDAGLAIAPPSKEDELAAGIGISKEDYFVFDEIEPMQELCADKKYAKYLSIETPSGYRFSQVYGAGMTTKEEADDMIILFYEGDLATISYGIMDSAAADLSAGLKGESLTRQALEEKMAEIKEREERGEYGLPIGIYYEDGVLLLFAGTDDPQIIMNMLPE